MKKHFLCKCGIHSYKIEKEYIMQDRDSNLIIVPMIRECIRPGCNKKQWRELHCLGMSPPRYTEVWFDISENDTLNIPNEVDIFSDDIGGLFIRSEKGDCYCLKSGKHIEKEST